jgi:hypothetical protein
MNRFLILNIGIILFLVGCGGGGSDGDDSSVSSSSGKYNLWNYFVPSTSRTLISKEIETKIQNGTEILIDNGDTYVEEYDVISDTKVISIKDGAKTTYTLKDNEIIMDEYDEDSEPQRTISTFSKNADIGDTIAIYPSSNEEGVLMKNHKCVLSNYVDEITIYKTKYNNVLEITCSADIIYNGIKNTDVIKAYFKKGDGIKASIDRTCFVGENRVDDSSSSCIKEHFLYSLYE